jgi:hypothetical protein
VALLALMAGPVVGVAPAAHSVGEGACTISGTISFSPSGQAAAEGAWRIGPAILDCQGIVAARHRIIGRGPFRGSGTFNLLPGGAGSCVNQAGTGTIEYTIPTSGGDILVNEPDQYTTAGAGTLHTPTLNGSLEILPPYEGDCVTKPITRATFLAEVVLLRYPREAPQPPHPRSGTAGR